MNIFAIGSTPMSIMLSVVVVFIGVGGIDLLWLRYKRPAPLRTAVNSREYNRVISRLWLLMLSKVVAVIVATIFTIVAIWAPNFAHLSAGVALVCLLSIFLLSIVRANVYRRVF